MHAQASPVLLRFVARQLTAPYDAHPAVHVLKHKTIVRAVWQTAESKDMNSVTICMSTFTPIHSHPHTTHPPTHTNTHSPTHTVTHIPVGVVTVHLE